MGFGEPAEVTEGDRSEVGRLIQVRAVLNLARSLNSHPPSACIETTERLRKPVAEGQAGALWRPAQHKGTKGGVLFPVFKIGRRSDFVRILHFLETPALSLHSFLEILTGLVLLRMRSSPHPTMSDFATYPDLKGQVALIMGIGQTGGRSSTFWGNGAAIARVLSYNRVNVFGCDLNLAAAEFTANRLRAEGGVCDVMAADVTSSSDVQKVVDAVLAKYGRIDILVNNVGMTAPGDPASLSEKTWDTQIDINLKSVYLSCHFILPIMERQGSGSIINNASIAGLRYIGKPQIGYNAAKAAVIHFTKVTAVLYAGKGVRLNSVAPGLIHTPLVEKFGQSEMEEERQAYRKITKHNVPMGRMGDAFDVANATAFLASRSAKYITGQQLVVDGGLTSSTGT